MRSWILWLSLTGCTRVHDLVVEEKAPGTAHVRFETRLEGTAHVRYRYEERGREVTVETPGVPASSGVVPVLGLPTGTELEFEVLVDGRRPSKPLPFKTSSPAGSVIALTQTIWRPELACEPEAYVLFSYLTKEENGVAIIDRDGDYVFSLERPPTEQIARVRPGRDGASLVFQVTDAARTEDIARLIRVDLFGAVVSETRTLWGHHDFVETGEGRFAWLGYDLRDVEAPPNDFGISGEICLAVDTLLEGPEGGGEDDATEVWNAWDPEDYPPGPDTLAPGAVICTPGTDLCKPSFLTDCYELGHGNSLAYLAGEDRYYMNWRWLDVTFEVTGDGALQWQWGGRHAPASDLEPATPDTVPFDGSHFSDVWPGGMLVFDNRDLEQKSRLVEYAFDGASYTEVWSHQEAEPSYEKLLGDVQRIPIEGCDNLLVSWSGQSKLQEITRDGEVVWEVVGGSTIGQAIARVTYLPELYDLSGLGYPD
jgi:hypothetical protein